MIKLYLKVSKWIQQLISNSLTSPRATSSPAATTMAMGACSAMAGRLIYGVGEGRDGMLEHAFTTIVEGLPTTIITGVILAPPAWTIKTTYSVAILKRKVDVSKQNCTFCQKLHEALERLIASPGNRVLREYVACLEADLRNRTYTNARSRIGKEVENTLRPPIRHSMIQYEKEKSYENYRRLKAGLSPVLFRNPPALLDQSLSLRYRYEFAKDCTDELAWIYVFHCNQAKDFIDKSPILRFLPFSIKKRLQQ